VINQRITLIRPKIGLEFRINPKKKIFSVIWQKIVGGYDRKIDFI